MKIKLLCRKEKEESYRQQLQNGEIRFGSPADLILMEPQFLLDELLIREEEGISIVSPQEAACETKDLSHQRNAVSNGGIPVSKRVPAHT